MLIKLDIYTEQDQRASLAWLMNRGYVDISNSMSIGFVYDYVIVDVISKDFSFHSGIYNSLASWKKSSCFTKFTDDVKNEEAINNAYPYSFTVGNTVPLSITLDNKMNSFSVSYWHYPITEEQVKKAYELGRKELGQNCNKRNM